MVITLHKQDFIEQCWYSLCEELDLPFSANSIILDCTSVDFDNGSIRQLELPLR